MMHFCVLMCDVSWSERVESAESTPGKRNVKTVTTRPAFSFLSSSCGAGKRLWWILLFFSFTSEPSSPGLWIQKYEALGLFQYQFYNYWSFWCLFVINNVLQVQAMDEWPTFTSYLRPPHACVFEHTLPLTHTHSSSSHGNPPETFPTAPTPVGTSHKQ